MSNRGNILYPILITVLIALIVSLFQLAPLLSPKLDFFRRLKWIAYDMRVQVAAQFPQSTTATNLAAVFIDEESVDSFASGELGFKSTFPFPRHVYGRIVNELNAQGAANVGFDVLFSRPSPSDSPLPMPVSKAEELGFTESDIAPFSTYRHIIESGSETNEVPGVLVESDAFFAVQMRNAGNVVLASEPTQSVFPAEIFRTNASGMGAITSEKDSDGVLRRIKPFYDVRIWHPALATELERNGFNTRNALVLSNKIVFSNSLNEQIEIPVDENRRFEFAQIEDGQRIIKKLKAFERHRIWHLGIVLAARILDIDLDKARIDTDNGRIEFTTGSGEIRTMPLDKQGRFLVDWRLTWNDDRLLTMSFSTLTAAYGLRHGGQAPLLQELRENGITNSAVLMRQLKESGVEKIHSDTPFKDKIVVVGSTMIGSNLTDMGATPVSEETYLVTTHWNVANSLITGVFVKHLPGWFNTLFILIMGAISGGITWKFRVPISTVLVVVVGGLAILVSGWVYIEQRCILPIVLPVFGALALIHLALVAYRVLVEQKEKSRVRGIFAKLVAPDVVNEVLQSEHLSLGGAQREITVFFADVRGFTAFTDSSYAVAEQKVRDLGLSGKEAEAIYDTHAREVLGTVNLYLGLIADIIKKHNGTLDKYMGDCVMAFWGAPLPNDHHAAACIRAAIEAQRTIAALNRDREAENEKRKEENRRRTGEGKPPLPLMDSLCLGTGINTGLVNVGFMGSDSHILNYTVFGRNVNLASRLEGISGKGRIIISENTYNHLRTDAPDLAELCSELEPVSVKGFRDKVHILEVKWNNAENTGRPD
ncbi:MAG: adenylate/guanylate cyclase domain-containing protein [Verrucomicrobia bacterium]|nr:adenylate/guanylate cyclase domain-containing protein [Verrucomicrobiota bacterium]